MTPPIGILDSGVGGLSVVRAIRQLMPRQDVLYYADTAGFPYGEKREDDIRGLVRTGIERLAAAGCQTVVLACNTASTQGLERYAADFPSLDLIGVTPLVHEATRATKTGKIIVLATFATLASDFYRALKDDISPDITVYAQACFDWVRLVETGQGDEGLVADQMRAFARHGIDTAVLACTHFAFLKPIIVAAAPEMTIIEPGEVIARGLLKRIGTGVGSGTIDFIVTGDEAAFKLRAQQLLKM